MRFNYFIFFLLILIFIPNISNSAFLETNGLVVFEAENYDENNPGTTDTWTLETSQSSYSGSGYMQANPNDGDNVKTNYAANSPELVFNVDFVTTGTYYVWIRGCGAIGGDNSLHAGINGNENLTANEINLTIGCVQFFWRKTRMNSAPDATLDITNTGVNQINIWMREDGVRVDKILLTTDSSYSPTGTGPVESPYDNNPPPPDPEGANSGECTDTIDNDNDGQTDCDDSDCSLDPACIVPDPEGTNSGECTDTIDNDNDEQTDCDDSDCSSDSACNSSNGSGAFIEENGLVVFEAENFDEKNPGTTDEWLFVDAIDFSGLGYMESGPNDGSSFNNNYSTNSPELKYSVNFSTVGIYNVWILGCGPSGQDNTLHAGINGLENTTANRIKLKNKCNTGMVWRKIRISSTTPDATIDIQTTGIQDVNIWMREDGSRVDKILLTTDVNFTPTGEGPAESTRTNVQIPTGNEPSAFNAVTGVQTNIPDEPWVEQKRTIVMNQSILMSMNLYRLNLFNDHDYYFVPQNLEVLDSGADYVSGNIVTLSGNVIGKGSVVIVDEFSALDCSARYELDNGQLFEIVTLDDDSVELVDLKVNEYFPFVESEDEGGE